MPGDWLINLVIWINTLFWIEILISAPLWATKKDTSGQQLGPKVNAKAKNVAPKSYASALGPVSIEPKTQGKKRPKNQPPPKTNELANNARGSALRGLKELKPKLGKNLIKLSIYSHARGQWVCAHKLGRSEFKYHLFIKAICRNEKGRKWTPNFVNTLGLFWLACCQMITSLRLKTVCPIIQLMSASTHNLEYLK